MDTQSLMQPSFHCTIFSFNSVGLSTEQITYKWLNSFIRVLNMGSKALEKLNAVKWVREGRGKET
jgi:hypothetical protein